MTPPSLASNTAAKETDSALASHNDHSGKKRERQEAEKEATKDEKGGKLPKAEQSSGQAPLSNETQPQGQPLTLFPNPIQHPTEFSHIRHDAANGTVIYQIIVPDQPCRLCNGGSPRFLQRSQSEPRHQSTGCPSSQPGFGSWPVRDSSIYADDHEAIRLRLVEPANPFQLIYYRASTPQDRHQDTPPTLYYYTTTTHSSSPPLDSIQIAPDRNYRGRLASRDPEGSSQIRSAAPIRRGRNPFPRIEEKIQGTSQEQLGAGLSFPAWQYERCRSWERRRPTPDS